MTVAARALIDGLAALGVGLVTGVPCAYFAGPLRLLEAGPVAGVRYVPAVNEGAALAIAAGARLAGEPAAVIAQNSGFGNLVNPLTSLLLPYRIPVLVLLSMRGQPVARPGEEQHHWMGRVVEDWLRSLAVPYGVLRPDGKPLDSVLAEAGAALAVRSPAFVLVHSGAMAAATGAPAAPPRGGPLRGDVVDALLAEVGDAYVVSTTGYLSRELFGRGDRPRNLYLQGSMGHAASVALGAALARPDRAFVVLDGDGALLMHLGALATVGHCLPPNLAHVVFDNAAYESTGAQPTPGRADLPALATACGYRAARAVARVEELRPALRWALDATGPVAVVVAGAPGGVPGGRASEALPPDEMADRFTRRVVGP